jgi:hypothetical protein
MIPLDACHCSHGEISLGQGAVKAMPVTIEENNKYRDFVSRIAAENGCFDFQPDQVIWH